MDGPRQPEDQLPGEGETRQHRIDERPEDERRDRAGLPPGVQREPGDGDDADEGELDPLTDPTAEPQKPI